MDPEQPNETEPTFLSREDPTDSDAFFEFTTFTSEEKEVFFGCRAVGLEEGIELKLAERNAVAAILQHRRMHAAPSWKYMAWLNRGSPVKEDRG